MLLHHPHDRHLVAEYGFDAVRGYWAATEYAGNPVTYEAADEGSEGRDALLGGLIFLGSFGFLAASAREALTWADERRLLNVPPELRRSVRVIRRWREAAGE